MGKPIPYDVRAKIARDFQAGEPVCKIVAETGVSQSGARQIIRRYKERGDSALTADYSRCGKAPRKHFAEHVESELDRRREKPPGSYYVSSVLCEQFTGERVPSARTVQRRWAKAGNPRKKGRPPQGANDWTEEVHHTWQIDGKEQIELSTGQQVSWGNIADEASGTDLRTEVFPPADDERGAAESLCRGRQPLF